MTVSPVVKWTGGKRVMAPWIAAAANEVLTRSGGRYVEPFLGGAAVALTVARKNMILADACYPLIVTYTMLARQPSLVWEAYNALAQGTSRDDFHNARDTYIVHSLTSWGQYLATPDRAPDVSMKRWGNDGHSTDWVRGSQRHAPPRTLLPLKSTDSPTQFAALFLYLNAMAFNGIYRVNRKNKFNAPYRGEASPPVFRSKRDLLAFAYTLRDSRLLCQSFEHTFEEVRDGDFVFCDPPYADTFTQYTSSGFDLLAHQRLAACVREAYLRGAKVLLTNSDTPEIRDMYSWAPVLISSTEKHATDRHTKTSKRAACLIVATDSSIAPVENT